MADTARQSPDRGGYAHATTYGLNRGCRPKSRLVLTHQLRQLGDVGRDSSSGSFAIFTAIRRASSLLSSLAGAPARLVLIIDVAQRSTIGVTHDKAGVQFLIGFGALLAASVVPFTRS